MSRTCIWERERDVPGGTNSLSNNWHIVGISGSIHGMGGAGRINRGAWGWGGSKHLGFIPGHQKDQQNPPHGDGTGGGIEKSKPIFQCL